MKLSGATIFYWISKIFPDAIYKNSHPDSRRKYGRPIYWQEDENICGQIVVINSDAEIGSLPLGADYLPVCRFFRNENI